MLGNEASASELPAQLQKTPLQAARNEKTQRPLQPSGFVLNPWTVKAFNSLYYLNHSDRRQIVDYDRSSIPLDRVLAVEPDLRASRLRPIPGHVPKRNLPASADRTSAQISHSRKASFLAVLKSSGQAGKGTFSYLYPGHTLALDFPLRPELQTVSP